MRIRISYNKGSPIRFTSTLDIHRIWEQSFRRASIKVTYSKGFHPQPRIQLGIPLPLGFIGLDEKVDIWIEDSLSLKDISVRLERNLPVGLEISAIQEINISERSLSSQIQYSDYRVYLLNDNFSPQVVNNKIIFLLNEKEIIREKRNGKKYDLRPLILGIELNNENQDSPFVFLRLLSQPNKTGRADEIMFTMGYSITDFIVERIGSYT
jgi:radical SAM-linked protein